MRARYLGTIVVSDLRKIHKNDLAKRVLGVITDAHGSHAPFDLYPLMTLGVFQAFRWLCCKNTKVGSSTAWFQIFNIYPLHYWRLRKGRDLCVDYSEQKDGKRRFENSCIINYQWSISKKCSCSTSRDACWMWQWWGRAFVEQVWRCKWNGAWWMDCVDVRKQIQ